MPRRLAAGSFTHLWAFEAKSGKLIWDIKLNDSMVTPEIVGGMIFAASLGTTDGWLKVYEANTGKFVWEQAKIMGYKDVEHIAAANGIAYIASHYDNRLRAFDAEKGTLLWDYSGKGGTIDWPVVVNGAVYCGSRDKHLRAFDAKTGKLIWDFKAGGRIDSPAIADGIAYSLAEDRFRAFEAKSGKLLWDLNAVNIFKVVDGIVYTVSGTRHISALDGKTGKLLWDVEGLKDVGSMKAADGLIYTESSDQTHFYGYDANNGRLLWDFETKDTISSPIAVGGIAYTGSRDGHFRAFDARTGRLLFDFNTGEGIREPLYVWDGVVSVASKNQLLFFDVWDITSGKYAPEAAWNSNEEFYSYLIWGQTGLAARKIIEGYSLGSVFSQSHMTKDELASGIVKLLRGKSYYGPGAAAVDPATLCPPWLQFAGCQNDDAGVKTVGRVYMSAASRSKTDGASYFFEALRLEPDIDLTEYEFSSETAVGIMTKVESSELKKKLIIISEKNMKNNWDRWLVGVAYLDTLSDAEAALRIAKRMQEADAKDSNGFWLAGLAFYRQGDIKHASDNFRKVTELVPDFIEGRQNYAAVLSDQGQHREAYNILLELIIRIKDKGEKPSEGLYNSTGLYAYIAGEKKAAFEYTQEALKLNPTQPNALYNLALLYAEEEDLDSAMPVYAKAIRADSKKVLLDGIGDLRNSIKKTPGSISAWFALGSLLEERLKNAADKERETIKQQAITAYGEYLSKATNSGWMEKARKRIEELKASK